MSEAIDPRVIGVYKRLWKYVTPHKLIGFIAVIAMAATAIIEMTMVALVEPMMDEGLIAHNLDAISWLPFAFVGVFIARGIAGFATEASLGWIGRSVISALRRDVFGKFLTLPTRYLETTSIGPMLSRMTYNVEMVAESVTNVVTILVRDFLTVLAAIGLMLYQSSRLFITVAILLPIIAALIRFLGKAFRRYSSKIQDSVGEVTQVSDEVLTGSRMVKIFGGQDYEMKRLVDVDETNRRQNLKLIRSRSLGVAVTQVIFGIGIAAVIYFAGIESAGGNLSPGSFMAFFGAMMLMMQPLRRITNVNATLQRGIAAGRSLFQIIDEPDEVDSGTYRADEVSGAVEFRNIRFSYRGESQILNDVSLKVKAGTTVAIVGPPGRSQPLAALRRAGRRHARGRRRALHARDYRLGGYRRGRAGAAYHDLVVARRGSRGTARGSSHPDRANRPALWHGAVHRLGGDVFRGLFLGLFRRLAVSKRGDRLPVAAPRDRNLRSLRRAPAQYHGLVALGRDRDLGPSRAARGRPVQPGARARDHGCLGRSVHLLAGL